MSSGFTRLAGWCAVITGAAALAYSITFAVVVQNGDRWAGWTSTLLLTAGALSGLPVLVALFGRTRAADEGLAGLGLLIGTVAAAGTLLHGAFDLGVLTNEPSQVWAYPNPTIRAALPRSCSPG